MKQFEPYAKANKRSHTAVRDCGCEVYHDEVLCITHFTLILLYLWDEKEIMDRSIAVRKNIRRGNLIMSTTWQVLSTVISVQMIITIISIS